MRLVAADPSDLHADLEVAMTLTDADGRFTFGLVPAGDYLLKAEMSATSPTPSTARAADELLMWANVPIAVGASDVDGLTIQLQPGLRIAGRLVFTGSSPPPEAGQIARASVWVFAADGRAVGGGLLVPAPAPAVRTTPDAGFTTTPLPKGRDHLSAASIGQWTFSPLSSKAVTSPSCLSKSRGGLRLMWSSRSPTTPRASLVACVEPTGSPRATRVCSFLQPDQAAWDASRVTSRRLRATRADLQGANSFVGLPAGDTSWPRLRRPTMVLSCGISPALERLRRTAMRPSRWPKASSATRNSTVTRRN